MSTLKPMIPAYLQQAPIWRSHLSSCLLVCSMPLCLYCSLFILSLSWHQQHYWSAWRIPSGTTAEIAISWNCLRGLSHYMLRVEWGRRWWQTLIYWEMSMVDMDIRWPMISGQSFVSLFMNICFVSFIVSIHSTHLTLSSPKCSPL